MEHGFASCHPAVNFIFFAGAILFGMFFVHPLFLVISLGASVGYYLLLKRRRGLWPLAGTAVLFAVVALFNPIFNARGDTCLLYTSETDGRYTIAVAVTADADEEIFAPDAIMGTGGQAIEFTLMAAGEEERYRINLLRREEAEIGGSIRVTRCV